ncbi:MAG: glycerol-3-phosphate dehydrogenase subunit GlpB [Deltaproteobacteria bacterium]|nr:glycerol-3-phosphate dehydrogenase subunit GlpB [Deltaproteobacteria bacterium]
MTEEIERLQFLLDTSADKKVITCDLAVIGAGMSGMAASLFAADRGVDTVQIGIASQIIFSSGLLDLLGVHPVETAQTWKDPWKAIDRLVSDQSDHPFARIEKKHIREAFAEVTAFLGDAGLTYRSDQESNRFVITSLGTLKPTYCAPATMWNGIDALQTTPPGLIVDIRGLRGFSARQITETLKPVWPGLRHATIAFPGMHKAQELYTEPMARSLAVAQNRQALAGLLRPLVEDARVLGVPAILGMQNSRDVQTDMEAMIGIPVFEIPTMPPSIPGLRIREAFETKLPEKGVRVLYQQRVSRIEKTEDGFLLEVGSDKPMATIKTKGVVLATGRFLGKGLNADRKVIREPLLGLPVYQPGARLDWHRFDFLDRRGHLINRSGLEIDGRFRPVDASGKPIYNNLYATGSILAHQDWMRQKCGSGLAIATAYAAVKAFLESALV